MATYQTPGVYVEEIAKFPPVITPVETALPAFIGYTEKAANDEASLTLVATKVSSLSDYESLFGGAPAQDVTLWLDAQNNVVDAEINHFFYLYDCIRLFFDNGGGACMIVSVGNYASSITHAALAQGLAVVEKLVEPTLIVMPEAVLTEDQGLSLYTDALEQCTKARNRLTICELPCKTKDTSFQSLVDAFRNGLTSPLEKLKYGAAYFPWLTSAYTRQIWLNNLTLKRRSDGSIIAPESLTSDATIQSLIADIYAAEAANQTPASMKSAAAKSIARNAPLKANIKLDPPISTLQKLNQALYEKYDLFRAWVTRAELALNVLPASGAVAAVFVTVDKTRGVWKAPANVALSRVAEPICKITNPQQETLNIDVSAGKSINAIRSFKGKGTLIWGARTLAGNDNEWRYVSVRRFMSFVEASVCNGMNTFVFEPNDANTWIRAQAMIENFLTLLWRQGALQGMKPEDAFFVRVGLGKTMTAQDILDGHMNIELGLATVRPAEFIIMKISQLVGQS
jgi:uncharacterized protein